MRKTVFLNGKQVKRTRKEQPGWEWKETFTRPVRAHSEGMFGQDIWFKLEKEGFVAKPRVWMGEDLSVFEQKLKNWLIWGYFEKDRSFTKK